jgi:lysophospholipase L1-like esterase
MTLLRRLAVILGITFALYVVLDLSVAALVGSPHPPIPDFDQVPALRGQPYATAQFGIEYVRNDFLDAVPDDRMMWEPLRHGAYFNVEALAPTGAHYRRTVDPPAGSRPVVTILFLGASTVYGTEVPDDLTLPSLLARRLDALDPAHAYKIYNAGVQSVTMVENVWRLQYELAHGLKPAIVVVMGGGVDVSHGVYQGRPGVPSAVSRGFLGRLVRDYFPLNIYHWLQVILADRATRSGARHPPSHLADSTRLAELVAKTAAAFGANERRLAELAGASGARFIAVLEPNLYTSTFNHPAEDVGYADQICSSRSPGLADAMRAAWPAMTAALADQRSRGTESLDLSQAFRDKTVDIFVDCDHFNAVGNEILAERLADQILKQS